jgi:hypothetical protein
VVDSPSVSSLRNGTTSRRGPRRPARGPFSDFEHADRSSELVIRHGGAERDRVAYEQRPPGPSLLHPEGVRAMVISGSAAATFRGPRQADRGGENFRPGRWQVNLLPFPLWSCSAAHEPRADPRQRLAAACAAHRPDAGNSRVEITPLRDRWGKDP